MLQNHVTPELQRNSVTPGDAETVIELSQREFQRVKGIENAVEGRMTVEEASRLLKLSTRQVKRLKRRRRAGTVDWVRHDGQLIVWYGDERLHSLELSLDHTPGQAPAPRREQEAAEDVQVCRSSGAGGASVRTLKGACGGGEPGRPGFPPEETGKGPIPMNAVEGFPIENLERTRVTDYRCR
jgi:hypothetical protein